MPFIDIIQGGKARRVRITWHAIERYQERVEATSLKETLDKLKGELEAADLKGKKDSHGAKYVYSGDKIIVIKVDHPGGWKIVTILKTGQRVGDGNIIKKRSKKG